MIEIRRIQPDEWLIVKQLVYRVAHTAFSIPLPLEEFIDLKEAQGTLSDIEDIESNYFKRRGVFLVTESEGQIIGTGAIRQLQDNICELRRVFLLFKYHDDQGLGYRMVMELIHSARDMRYEKTCLETAPVHLKRATALYKSLGFYEIPKYESTHPNDIAMEMVL